MNPAFLKKNGPLLIICLLVFGASFLFWGLHYERYESFLTGLFSGQFTPGTPYDHFYFFGHVGLLTIYAHLYKMFPEIPWMNFVLYLSIGTSLFLIILSFVKSFKKSFLLGFVLFVIAAFYIEQHVFFIHTRVSFLLSFSALFCLLSSQESQSLSIGKYFLFFGIFMTALITRSEPAMIMLLLVALFDFTVLSKGALAQVIFKQLKLYFLPGLACLLYIGAYLYDVQHADKFYKQIEPELEYELMSRNNIVGVSAVTTRIDSFRYQAVFNGMWGDATTNDAAFLRSLVGGEQNSYSNLVSNGWNALIVAIENCKGVFYLNWLSFSFVFLSFVFLKKYKISFRLVLYHVLFWALIFLKSYKVKMIETALSPILLAVSILYLFLLLQETNVFRKKMVLMMLICFSAAVVFELNFISERRKIFQETHLQELKKREYLENNFAGKKLYLNQESSSIFADSFQPFEKIEIDHFKRVYYFDKQHLTTLEPYRSFLAKECNCDPNNYAEFFQHVIAEKDQSIFLMSESYKDFLSSYLYEVHDLSIVCLEIQDDLDEINWVDKQNNLVKIYRLVNPEGIK
jgi:hypothetical protein